MDDTILAFAKQSGLEGSHPLWGGVRAAGGLTDIVPVGSEEREAEKKPARRGKKKATAEPVKLTVREEPEEIGRNRRTQRRERRKRKEGAGKETAAMETHAFEEEGERFFKRRSIPEIMAGTGREEEEEETSRRMPRKLIGWIVGIVVLILVVLGVMTWGFGHVTIAINFQKTPWTYQDNFVADKSVSAINADDECYPGADLFNAEEHHPAIPGVGKRERFHKSAGDAHHL